MKFIDIVGKTWTFIITEKKRNKKIFIEKNDTLEIQSIFIFVLIIKIIKTKNH